MADRCVQDLGLLWCNGWAPLRKAREAGLGDEALLQNAGRHGTRQRRQLGNMQAGFVVDPLVDLLAHRHCMDDVPAQAGATGHFGPCENGALLRCTRHRPWHQPLRLDQVGDVADAVPGHAHRRGEVGRQQVGVVQHRGGVRQDARAEVGSARTKRHWLQLPLDARVGHRIQFHLADEADGAAAANGRREQLRPRLRTDLRAPCSGRPMDTSASTMRATPRRRHPAPAPPLPP